MAQWSVSPIGVGSAIGMTGCIMLYATPRFLKGKPLALRALVAGAVAAFIVTCFGALHFLP